LYVRASDGTLWSGWVAFTMTAPLNRTPVVSASNLTAVHLQTSVAALSLFSATDADGDSITKYALWDTQGNGHWVVNGATQATNAEIDITAAQLALTTYRSGNGTDQLYVRAYDGIAWGAWQAFTVIAPVNQAPVVTAPNVAIPTGGSRAASSLF